MRREWTDDRLKLAHHRVVARAMQRNPGLLDEARKVVSAWSRHRFRPSYVDTWNRLLDSHPATVHREIVRDTPHADWLRGSSPFSMIPSLPLTRDQVRRFWRIASARAIRILQPAEYPLFATHLKRLGSDDRLFRFWSRRDDTWIDAYVDSLGPGDSVIGHFNDRMVLDGAAHVSLVDNGPKRMVEIGISVLPESRHHGIGHHLMHRAVLWSRNHRATSILAFCMTSNQKMIQLARDTDMEVFRDDEGLEGVLHVPPGDTDTLSYELLENQFGEWDYWTKAHETALSLAVGPLPILTDANQMSRLDKLVAMGRTDLITTYIIVLRYLLTHSGIEGRAHGESLARLHALLEPKVRHDPHLHGFVETMPETLLN